VRPYDAWTDEEALICAIAMFIGLIAGFWYFYSVIVSAASGVV
jgi:hypothetical protein